jgi:hypothetical protein
MVAEIDVHEESALRIGKMSLHHEEAALQRLCAGLCNRRKHIRFIVGPERPDRYCGAVA